ncbi:MAG TPA: ATP-binding protein, partial [Anaeromyxobacteraceae bacterium]|nr:ATP-binding protein [Anaeromyxobacteraceae bacterium]
LHSQLKDSRIGVERRLQPVRVMGNANQLQQVVVNLVVNALQAMGASGRIAVETAPGPGGRARLAVADSGPGVPPELAERIFEPFFTTKPEGQGTGLGLSICYRIAEEHGGSIALERPAQGGARFVIDLPQAG